MSLVSNNFLPEDGTGLTDATSYLSILEADTYNNNVNVSEEWGNYEEEKKRILLNKASLFLSNNYNFIGEKFKQTQSLEFPRLIDSYESEIFPDNVKYACMEVAILLDDNEIFISTVESERFIKSQKVGPLQTVYEDDKKNYEYQERSRQNKLQFVDKLLKDYIYNQSILLR